MYLCFPFCNFVDFEKNVLTEHMTLIHDIPSEELTQKCGLLTKDVNVAIHRVLEGQTVLLAQVYKSGFFPPLFTNLSSRGGTGYSFSLWI